MNSEENFKEKVKRALLSTFNVLSVESEKKIEKNSINNLINSNFINFDSFEHNRDFNSARAKYDSFALKQRFSNEHTLRKYYPNSKVEINLYKISEKIRYETIGAKEFKGVKKNIIKYYEEINKLNDKLNIKSKEDSSISVAFELYLLKKIFNLNIENNSKKILDFWESEFEDKIKDKLKFFLDNLYNQEEYNSKFSEIIKSFNILSENEDKTQDTKDETKKSEESDNDNTGENKSDNEETKKDENIFDVNNEVSDFRMEEDFKK